MHTIHLLPHLPTYLAMTDDLGVGTTISRFTNILTGPVAKFIAVVAIIAGAGMLIQGREGHEGLRHLGIIVMAVGLLAGIPTIWNAFHPTDPSGMLLQPTPRVVGVRGRTMAVHGRGAAIRVILPSRARR